MTAPETLALLLLCSMAIGGMARAESRLSDEEPSRRAQRARQLVGELPDFDRIWPLGLRGIYAPPTDAEREAFRTLIPGLLKAAVADKPLPEALRKTAAGIGFTIERWSVRGDTIWALLEQPERRRGAGAYLFRVGDTDRNGDAELLLEAPHAYFDRHTELVAGTLFFAPPKGSRKPRALFTNTLQRYRGRPGETKETPPHPADVAHNPEHLFQLATLLAASTLEQVEVLQLHGFGSHQDDEGRAVDQTATMVVSGGRKTDVPPRVRALAKGLREAFGEGVKLFPDQIDALGATTNVQGRALSERSGAEFVHLELSQEFRNEFLESGDLRLRLAQLVLGRAK